MVAASATLLRIFGLNVLIIAKLIDFYVDFEGAVRMFYPSAAV
jgi:hypothetical protein